MENMQSIFNKIEDKLAEVKGNVMAFGDREELEFDDEPNGVCELCEAEVPVSELERNDGICADCTKREIE